MVIINKKNRQLDIIEKIVGIYKEVNNHGFSLWSYNYVNNDEVLVRTLDYSEFKEVLKNVKNYNIVHIHLRYASSGLVSIDNVHMWRISNNSKYYYVSHNGYVHKYCKHKYIIENGIVYIVNNDNSIYSDTYELVNNNAEFRELIFAEKFRKLSRLLDDVEFHGVMFLTNPSDLIVISVGKEVHIYDYGNVLIMSNSDFTEMLSEFNTTYKRYGFKFSRKIPHTALDNIIFKYDISKMKITKKYRIKKCMYLLDHSLNYSISLREFEF